VCGVVGMATCVVCLADERHQMSVCVCIAVVAVAALQPWIGIQTSGMWPSGLHRGLHRL
jgi:hypothetical protein